MSFKYGELTIIYKEENIFSKFFAWLSSEEQIEVQSDKLCKCIFLFEDGEICDSDEKLKDFKFEFRNSYFSPLPLHFDFNKEENKSNTYFNKFSNINIDQISFDYNSLFNTYSKFDSNIVIPNSIYNCIYFCHNISSSLGVIKQDVFGIIRIQSNENMPRFQFAYDSNEFTKEEIIYLIDNIFNNCKNKNYY